MRNTTLLVLICALTSVFA